MDSRRVSQSIPRWMFDHFEVVGLSKTLENIVKMGRPIFSEIAAWPLAGWLLYSFLTQIFLQIVVLERECRSLGFGKFVKIVSPTSFEIVAQTHARVSQSIPRGMFDHFEEVGLSKTLGNIVELGRPTCSEIVARPLTGWLLYSFLIRVFFNWWF